MAGDAAFQPERKTWTLAPNTVKPMAAGKARWRSSFVGSGCRLIQASVNRGCPDGFQGSEGQHLYPVTRMKKGEKMKNLIFIALSVLLISIPAQAADGVVNVPSDFSLKETADRMEGVLKKKGMTLFNRINHSEGAGRVGIELRGTELIIFGNPKVGSPLMKCRQGVAIDLPQKALIWEDNEGKVSISYNNPRYLQKRHGIIGCDDVISKIEKALAGIAKSAAIK